MDRRVLFASLILFAGGATGVGVALFAFVGIDDTTADAEVVWETGPVAGDDGSGAVVATMDGDSLVLQSTLDDGERVVRATAAGGNVEWTTPVSTVVSGDADDASGDGSDTDGDDPATLSPFVSGRLDGEAVVAFTTESGSLVVLNAADGSERFVADLDGAGGFRPAIGDISGDGTAAVAATTTDGRVLAVDDAGAVVFETDLGASVDLRPLIVEDDGDGSAVDDSESDGTTEARSGIAIATGGDDGTTVHLLDENGDARWTTTPQVTPLSWNAADTQNGAILALGGTNGNLETLEVADGSLRYEIGLQDLPVAVGDADPGRIHVGGAGNIWAVNLLDGEVIWKQQYGAQTRVNPPGVADVNGDGEAGPVAVNRGGDVLVLNSKGRVLARGGIGSAVVYAGPLFADANGDGNDEVLVVTENGRIVAFAA